MKAQRKFNLRLIPVIVVSIAILWLMLFISACQAPAEPLTTEQPSSISPIFNEESSVEITPQPPGEGSQQEVCDEEHGTIEEKTLTSGESNLSMEVSVYLPPCYNPDANAAYPVIYLLHGQNFTQQHWIQLGISELADRAISSGESDPFILVFPGEKNDLRNPDISEFPDAITTSLVPWVDENYHTCAARNCRIIAGISRGAGWAVHVGLTHPDLFGAIGAHSLVPFESDANDYAKWLDALPEQSTPRIYLDMGDQDRYRHMTYKFEQLLFQEGIPHEWHLNSGGHNTDYWSGQVKDYLKWYTQILADMNP
jgi:enterochelin esterase-like enzyme